MNIVRAVKMIHQGQSNIQDGSDFTTSKAKPLALDMFAEIATAVAIGPWHLRCLFLDLLSLSVSPAASSASPMSAGILSSTRYASISSSLSLFAVSGSNHPLPAVLTFAAGNRQKVAPLNSARVIGDSRVEKYLEKISKQSSSTSSGVKSAAMLATLCVSPRVPVP
jgi:hypothetical protein